MEGGGENAIDAGALRRWKGIAGVQLSGQRMIVMEWVDGVKLTDEQGLREARIRPRTAGLLLLAAFAHMLLEDGFVHADLHPGNILVRPHPNPSASFPASTHAYPKGP